MGRWLILYALLLAGCLQAESGLTKCRHGNILCKDGSECIRYSLLCDGENDCKDGSDEENCESGCSEDQFQCAHGMKCIDKNQVCDGVPQCQDNSDEQQCIEQTEGCHHQCDDNSRCLPANFVCDGERDCVDASDEAHCGDQDEDEVFVAPVPAPSGPPVPIRCTLGSKPCKDNSDCVHYNHVCDGEADCKDGSDEEDCSSTCEKEQFQCAHGRKCIERTQVCDGVPHCQDRSDELACAKYVEGCVHQCDDKSRCIPSSFLCDGEKDCVDGTDETTCAHQECSDSEFRCASGQCVSANMRCDGHPDCWDRSDEESCTKTPICPTRHRCPQSKECLVPAWICDGDQDCEDGTDEKDCPVVLLECGDFQWQCKSKMNCIPTVWKCDGMKDCDDGSDETECGTVTCLPHEFQCGSKECLDPGLVCNGIINCADGSDEGGNCQFNCAEVDIGRCSEGCYSTPLGTRCRCAAGYQLMEDGVTCADVDECEGQTPGVCSHLCINTLGSYQCDCYPGFIMEAGGHQCKIASEPFLLSSVQTDLYLSGLRSGSLDVLSSSAKKPILSLDYDLRDQKVFWVSVAAETIRWSSLNEKKTGSLVRGVRADSVAVDWLGRNLYWIDGLDSEIVAIKLQNAPVKSLDRAIILHEDLDQPRSLALLPQKGLMFWTEIGDEVKIERAGMDGSQRRVVVNSSLGWPGGIAVDTISDRIFWTDERLRVIGSATLDGDDKLILQMKETANPFSLAVFNDMLYWSDAKKRVVQAAYKLNGKNRHVVLKRPKQPFAVKIIHPILQMDTESPCKKMDCSHMCVLAPERKAVCKCPSGLLLAEDGLTCSTLVTSTFLLFLSSSTVTQIYMQSKETHELKDWPEHLALEVSSANKDSIMDYNLREHTLLLTDGKSSLGSFKLKDSALNSQGQFLRLLDDTITAMALDWMTLNAYWSSEKQPRLQVTSKTGAYTAVLIRDGIGRVGYITLHPSTGRVCLTNLDAETGKTTIECAHMDGAERRVVWKDAVKPTSLTFSNNGNKVYWADTATEKIGSVQMDGSGYEELEAGQGLRAMALRDKTLIWIAVDAKGATKVWHRHQQKKKLWFEVDSEIFSLKTFSKSSQKGSNRCTENNGGCQHFCLPTPAGQTCKCAHDHVLKDTTCNLEQSCSAGSQLCLDQKSCQPIEKFCNGHVDCPDNSDENCVNLKQWSGPKLSAPAKPRSFSPSPSPQSPPSFTEPGSSENVSSHHVNLEAQLCSQRRCNGNGNCVDFDGIVSCLCSKGYSGDFCQTRLPKTLQGPIIYGAVGLGVGVLVIAIIAVAVKRSTASRTTSFGVAKEIGLTELEKKVETTPNTMTEADKPKEAASSVD